MKQAPAFDGGYIGFLETEVTSLAWKNIGDSGLFESTSLASTDCECLASTGRIPLLITLSALAFLVSISLLVPSACNSSTENVVEPGRELDGVPLGVELLLSVRHFLELDRGVTLVARNDLTGVVILPLSATPALNSVPAIRPSLRSSGLGVNLTEVASLGARYGPDFDRMGALGAIGLPLLRCFLVSTGMTLFLPYIRIFVVADGVRHQRQSYLDLNGENGLGLMGI